MDRYIKSPVRKRRDRVVYHIETAILFIGGVAFFALAQLLVKAVFAWLGL